MSEYRSDEETVELIQRFWRENGVSVVLAIVLALGGTIGWRWWQDSRDAEVGAASGLYLEYRQGLTPDGALSPEAEAAADALRADHPTSPYVSLLRFEEAKRAVDADDLAAARRELLAVLDAELPAAFHDIARVRLARLDLAEDDAAAALARLAPITDAGDLATVLELRGDAHRVAGDLDAARAAYDEAIAAVERSGAAERPLLQMKRDDIASVAAPEAP